MEYEVNPLSVYKNNIALKIISNNNLVKALIINDSRFLDQSLPKNFEISSLLYSQIFPYAFVPDINTEPQTFITMSFDNFRYINNKFKSGIVTFYVFTYKSLIPTDFGLRYDYILHQIDQMFNKKYEVGAFNLVINGGGDFHANENYYGSTASYKFTDFQ